MSTGDWVSLLGRKTYNVKVLGSKVENTTQLCDADAKRYGTNSIQLISKLGNGKRDGGINLKALFVHSVQIKW